MRGWLDSLTLLRAPLFVAGAVFLLLAEPGQMLELYAIDTENVATAVRGAGATTSLFDVGFLPSVASIFVFPFLTGVVLIAMLWLCSIHLLGSRRAGGTRTAAELVLPVVIALAPALGMITGLYRAIAHARLLGQSQDEPALEAYIAVMWGILFLLAVALGWLTYLHFDRLSAFTAGKFKLRYTSLALLVLVAMSLAAMYGDSMSPAHMGVVGLIFTCAILLVYILSAFASHYRARGVPITLIVLAFAVTIAYFGLNDNHQVSAKILTSPAPILEPSFLEWAQHRGDREQFASERKPYPIYIVAAEGGGLYAAYHVATALSRLQDACPNFAQHVFGISSVSGGSLGAAVFAAAAKDMTANGP